MPHHRQHHVERRWIFVGRMGGDDRPLQSRLFIRRALLTAAGALAWSGSSRCFFFAIFAAFALQILLIDLPIFQRFFSARLKPDWLQVRDAKFLF
jgi:hypothetical protein